MKLEENIYRLRTERGLSQTELAEKLEVSRQSVSKWETGAAVPELEKLIRMSTLFGVTLDALVSGVDEPEGEREKTSEPVGAVCAEPSGCRRPLRKNVGLVLLGLAVLAALLLTIAGSLSAGLLCALPLAVCGAICMICRRHCGLWCAWAVVGMADLFLRLMSGIGINGMFGGLRSIFRGNIAGMLIGTLWIALLGIEGFTIAIFGKMPGKEAQRGKRQLILSAVLLVLFLLPWPLQLFDTTGWSIGVLSVIYGLLSLIRTWGQVALTAVFGVALVREIRKRKAL